MRTSTFISMLLPILTMTVAADVVPAVRRSTAETHIDNRQSANPLLGKRQFCGASYPYVCSAIDGDAMCMAENEVCCQRIATDGIFPYVCDYTHPYCCPTDNGVPQCGSDDTCGGGGFEAAPTQALATETTGVAPQTTTAAGGQSKATNASPAKPTKTNAANQVGGMNGGGIALAMLGIIAYL
jgi:hypothetical protein